MIELELLRAGQTGSTILCLGAHADDIEIGCGGSVLTFLQKCEASTVWWIVFSANGVRKQEAQRSADLFMEGLSSKKAVFLKFRDGYFPSTGAEIKDFFEDLKKQVNPDLIFTHYRHDLHQDHRLISELTWNTFRDHLILEYEIPKYDGDFGTPNCYIRLEDHVSRKKIDNIMAAFRSQAGRLWFTEDLFSALMRLRGMECNAPARYAEAFYCRKFALGWNRHRDE